MSASRYFVVIALLVACSSDPAPSSPTPGLLGGSSGSGAAQAGGVDCTHPGAGKQLDNGLCECTTTRDVSGDWSAARTCRDGDTCPVNAADESMTFTQSGSDVSAQSATYRLTGKLCGDFIQWTGGPTSGTTFECGQIRFTSDTTYVKDSCYVPSGGSCKASFGQGCPSEQGECTAVGAKKPAAAPPIVKDLCH
jgi:hypothetical protein